MDNVTATAALRNIAAQACEKHFLTVTHQGKEVTVRCRIVDVSDVRFNLMVSINALCTKAEAQKLLSETRSAIREAAIAANVKWRFPRQPAKGGGKTWVHNTGFWHMNQFCETDRYAVLIGGETGRSI